MQYCERLFEPPCSAVNHCQAVSASTITSTQHRHSSAHTPHHPCYPFNMSSSDSESPPRRTSSVYSRELDDEAGNAVPQSKSILHSWEPQPIPICLTPGIPLPRQTRQIHQNRTHSYKHGYPPHQQSMRLKFPQTTPFNPFATTPRLGP